MPPSAGSVNGFHFGETKMRPTISIIALAALFTACGEASTDDDAGSGAGGANDGVAGAGDSGAAGAGEEPDPTSALTTNVWGDDGATGYLYTVRSLAEGTASLEDAIEIPGGAWIYGREGDRFVYVSSGEL